MPTIELSEPVHERLESEAKRRGLSPSDTIDYLLKGIVPPRVGNGTFEEIMRAAEAMGEGEIEDGFIAAIEENQAMRRQLTHDTDFSPEACPSLSIICHAP